MTVTKFEFPVQLAMAANNPTVRSLYKSFSEGRVVLRPAFQRNLVWNDEQRSYLIDSILRNMPIPELYVQRDVREEDDAEVITVVDGQQRLSTCIDFFLGKLRLSGSDLDPRWGGRTVDELEPPLVERFKSYHLLVRELPSLPDPQLREIFKRLNRVVEPLLPQELRHAAYSGPFIKLIEAVASHESLQELRVFSSRDVRRRKSDELVAEIALPLIHGAFPNKKEGLDQAFASFERTGFPPELAAQLTRRWGRVFRELEAHQKLVRSTRFRNKSDFYSLVVMLLRRAESLPLPDANRTALATALSNLSDAVGRLRTINPEDLAESELSENDRQAVKYLRAVEKAASDRLSRVRRNEVLEALVGPALANPSVVPLGPLDEVWLEKILSEAQAEDEEPEALQKEQAELLSTLSNTT